MKILHQVAINFVLGLAGLSFEGYWGTPGRPLGTSSALWDASRALLGRFLALIGVSNPHFERFWEPLGLHFAAFKRPNTCWKFVQCIVVVFHIQGFGMCPVSGIRFAKSEA